MSAGGAEQLLQIHRFLQHHHILRQIAGRFRAQGRHERNRQHGQVWPELAGAADQLPAAQDGVVTASNRKPPLRLVGCPSIGDSACDRIHRMSPTTRSHPRELIRELYGSFAAGNVTAVLAAFADNIVWNEAENFVYADGNPYRGPQAVLNGIFQRLAAEWDGFAVMPESFVSEGDRVVVFGRYCGTYKTTSKSVDAICSCVDGCRRKGSHFSAVHRHTAVRARKWPRLGGVCRPTCGDERMKAGTVGAGAAQSNAGGLGSRAAPACLARYPSAEVT